MEKHSIVIGQKYLATDHYGSYYNKPVIVIGFTTNIFGMELIKVRLIDDVHYGRETVFYPSELTEV